MIIKEAFVNLYPNKEFNFTTKLNYSKRFKEFNANLKRVGNNIEMNLSYEWKDIGREIQMGLIQHLLMRLFKAKKETIYTDLYHNFIKNLGKYTPITESNPILVDSFNRINEKYFQGLMEQPNLKFGQYSTTQLGVYNFHDDTITISSIFTEEPELLDYIMYHELLHKKEKFTAKNGTMRYHTTNFRKLEKQFENFNEVERKVNILVRSKKKVKMFKWF